MVRLKKSRKITKYTKEGSLKLVGDHTCVKA